MDEEERNLLKLLGDQGYKSEIVVPVLRQIEAARFNNNRKGYQNYLKETTALFQHLSEIDGNYVVNKKNGRLRIHLYPPTDKLELGEYYFQAGISQPGSLVIKFGRLNKEGKLEESQAMLEKNHYEKCMDVKFFKEIRDKAVFAGDCLFRLCLTRDFSGKVKKIETKELLDHKNRRKLRKSKSEYVEPDDWPKTLFDLDSTLCKCITNGLSKETYLPGKDHLSFARKMGYSEEEVLRFDRSDQPAKAIISDLRQTHPTCEVKFIMEVLQQMDRQDIILTCREHRKGQKRFDKGRSLDVAQIRDESRLRASTDPPLYHHRREPVESSEIQPTVNPSYPSIDQAMATNTTQNPSYPTLGAAVCTESPTNSSHTVTRWSSSQPKQSSPSNSSYPPLSHSAQADSLNETAVKDGITAVNHQGGAGVLSRQAHVEEQLNSQYPPIGKSVGDLVASNNRVVSSSSALNQGRSDNPVYPSLSQHMEDLQVDSIDSINEIKRHLQPETDLSLPDDIE